MTDRELFIKFINDEKNADLITEGYVFDTFIQPLVDALVELLESECEVNEKERRRLKLKDDEHIISGNFRKNRAYYDAARVLDAHAKRLKGE